MYKTAEILRKLPEAGHTAIIGADDCFVSEHTSTCEDTLVNMYPPDNGNI